MDTLIVPVSDWRGVVGLKPRYVPKVNVQVLNAISKPDGSLYRWLSRDDVLVLLYREAERLESKDLRVLADTLAESTKPRSH